MGKAGKKEEMEKDRISKRMYELFLWQEMQLEEVEGSAKLSHDVLS